MRDEPIPNIVFSCLPARFDKAMTISARFLFFAWTTDQMQRHSSEGLTFVIFKVIARNSRTRAPGRD